MAPIQLPAFHFDKDLREIPDRIQDWEAFVESMKERLDQASNQGDSIANTSSQTLECLEYLGVASRVLGRFSQAEQVLLQAVTECSRLGLASRYIQNLIRLAHVHQWQKTFGKAHSLFDEARVKISGTAISEGLLAAYHQHLGKLYFDEKFYGMAQVEFATALLLRQRISAPQEQVSSSGVSIDEARFRWGRSLPAEVIIRRALVTDAEAIHIAHMKSIQEICSRDHASEEIKVWGNRPFREEQRISAIKNDLVWVVETGQKIEGYAHLKISTKAEEKVAHIFGLYLTPTVLGKGIGRLIVEIIIEAAKAAGAMEMTLESTITAHSFYASMGFIDSGPQQTIEISGVGIRCFPMRLK